MNIIKTKIHRSLIATIGISVLALLLISIFTTDNQTQVQAESDTKELTGYAWSSNIGWISMNCSNTSSCNQSDYKVTLDESTDNLTGYAWSSNVGWLQFGNLSGFPAGNGTQSVNARINESGEMEGWTRFLSYGDDTLLPPNNPDEPIDEPNCEITDLETDFGGKFMASSYWGTYGVHNYIKNYTGNIWPRYIYAEWQNSNSKFIFKQDSKNMRMNDYHIAMLNSSESFNISSNTEMNITYTISDGKYSNSNIMLTKEGSSFQFGIGTSFVDNGFVLSSGTFGHSISGAESIILDPGSYRIRAMTQGLNSWNEPRATIDFEAMFSKVGSSCSDQLSNIQNFSKQSDFAQSSESLGELAWDGWVSLSGDKPDGTPLYGPTRSGDNLSGYAWGDDVVGWIDFSGVFIDEATAQCGSIHNTTVDNKPSTNLCENGTPTNVSENNEDTWGWECIVDDSYEISDLDSPNTQCSASCANNEWICGDSCIPLTQSCDDESNEPNDCPASYELDGSGECTPITKPNQEDIPSATIEQFEASPRIINEGGTCNIVWSITTSNAELINCTVSSDFDSEQTIQFNPSDASGQINGTESFSGVDSTTEYTLTCSDIATGAELDSQTARCSINPNFQEF